jgi:hypothetical protein
MPGVLETGVSPPVLVETLWTSARGAIRHPSLRFGMSIIPTSSPIIPTASPVLRATSPVVSAVPPAIPASSPVIPAHSPVIPAKAGIHGGGCSAPQSRTDLQDHVC